MKRETASLTPAERALAIVAAEMLRDDASWCGGISRLTLGDFHRMARFILETATALQALHSRSPQSPVP